MIKEGNSKSVGERGRAADKYRRESMKVTVVMENPVIIFISV